MPFFVAQSREELRSVWRDAWQRHRRGEVLTALQAQLVQLIEEHPEYAPWFAADTAPTDEPTGGTSPFLHLSLHLAIREQVATDLPPGIAAEHRRLCARFGARDGEHRMLEVLGQLLWDAQRSGQPPDERLYLERVRRL
ncbi:MAG: DUF1841 family protein [Steroidobacteraceae bacterium]|nr:DUF1841 family protein [Steroidobacteraceae bacterium]MDW8258253.1 DUF1841 family protein [Gammaproteobacteria bacterium]